ncbi:hypothetical protein GTR02_07195 [Kineococcus sp. R8]|uniref:hypothetical protein n=1 Tax=Kineococcus siccus TaxID=2696567 RepID=UPI001413335F|nr:hypothetical protein [Kineococcus siccus]NAZ81601.1 hypothetical protein [Kineococcus siccus]
MTDIEGRRPAGEQGGLDSGMATGSDAGEPGAPGPGDSPGGEDAGFVEGTVGAALSAHDDAPLPALAGDDGPDDPRTPEFREPTERAATT